MAKVLAFDFGASSGRAILANYQDGSLTYKEVHRFENKPIEKDGRLCWDFDDLMQNVRTGIEKAGNFDSVGFDTWGVDFGLLGGDGKLLQNPVHYRDKRTVGALELAYKQFSAEQLYEKTGNQIMEINTLFQLLAMKRDQPELLAEAKTLLFMPDLFAYMLCGKPTCEATIASTSQMLNPKTGEWRTELMDTIGISSELFCKPVASGTVIGQYGDAKVIAVAGHDTQCAVAAMPALEPGAAFLSCGTWSLFGCELDEPLLTSQSMELSLSNELGANGKVNYLKNIIGLWLIQECRRAWQRQGEDYSYARLERLALEAKPFACFIDPDHPDFVAPGDLPERIRNYCARTGQHVPETVGEVMRCVYESLALKYRFALGQLRSITGQTFDRLHVLGGGTKDTLLCQMTADSCGINVMAGPVEATALGNILIQLTALGELSNLDEGRTLICKTEQVNEFLPDMAVESWNEAYNRFVKCCLS